MCVGNHTVINLTLPHVGNCLQAATSKNRTYAIESQEFAVQIFLVKIRIRVSAINNGIRQLAT